MDRGSGQAVSEDQFLAMLFDVLAERQQQGRFPWDPDVQWLSSRDKLHPPIPGYHGIGNFMGPVSPGG